LLETLERITQTPNALYFPTAPEYPQVMQDAEKAMLPFAQIDPTSTLYSNTFASKGTILNSSSITVLEKSCSVGNR